MKKTMTPVIPMLFSFLILIGCGTQGTPDGWSDINPSGLRKLNSPVEGDGNAFLLLGAVPVKQPVGDQPPGLVAFSGRWEGCDMGQPVPGDLKIVLVITSIDTETAEGTFWSGYDFQSVHDLKKIRFTVTSDGGYGLQSDVIEVPSEKNNWRTGTSRILFRYDETAGALLGTVTNDGFEKSLILKRGNGFITYRDYPAYLKGLGINVVRYTDTSLKADGDGMLVYLPPRYDAEPEKRWPLIYFFHGTGDTGKDITVLAKASPFMYIRSGGVLPAVIVAPALRDYSKYRSFTPEYLKAVYDKVVADYRIDTSRVYVTGLSMGGESAYRFALEFPDLVRAAAPLCFGDPGLIPGGWSNTGFKPLPQPYTRALKVPFLIIHGADDAVIPHMFSIDTAKAMQKAGLDVTLSILEGHGHDVWTDTYSDPAFYDWLLSR